VASIASHAALLSASCHIASVTQRSSEVPPSTRFASVERGRCTPCRLDFLLPIQRQMIRKLLHDDMRDKPSNRAWNGPLGQLGDQNRRHARGSSRPAVFRTHDSDADDACRPVVEVLADFFIDLDEVLAAGQRALGWFENNRLHRRCLSIEVAPAVALWTRAATAAIAFARLFRSFA